MTGSTPRLRGAAVPRLVASFQRAVAREGFSQLLMDDCYGDFGHGTARGNRLLAENVAAAILAELAGKR